MKLKEANFRLVRFKNFNFLGIWGWWVNSCLLKRTSMGRWQLKIYDTLVPLLRLMEKLLPLPGSLPDLHCRTPALRRYPAFSGLTTKTDTRENWVIEVDRIAANVLAMENCLMIIGCPNNRGRSNLMGPDCLAISGDVWLFRSQPGVTGCKMARLPVRIPASCLPAAYTTAANNLVYRRGFRR